MVQFEFSFVKSGKYSIEHIRNNVDIWELSN